MEAHPLPLPTPAELHERVPASARARRITDDARAALRAALRGLDPRPVVIVGPCSIHDPAAVLEYAGRLLRLAARLEDDLLVVMRTYFEKPRTSIGWKGFLEDPALDDSGDAARGLEEARTLLAAIVDSGLPCGTELVEPLTSEHLSDLLCWVSIGARTVESPVHRALASGLPCPVGLKNRTDGSIEIAANALRSVRQPQRRFGLLPSGAAAQLRTAGNSDAHLVLRGGAARENYFAHDVQSAALRIEDPRVRRGVLVDCSHANARYTHERQAHVCREVIAQLRDGAHPLLGFMLESHLNPGSQAWRPGARLAHGVSITDACIGWPETERLLEEAARAAAARGRTRCDAMLEPLEKTA